MLACTYVTGIGPSVPAYAGLPTLKGLGSQAAFIAIQPSTLSPAHDPAHRLMLQKLGEAAGLTLAPACAAAAADRRAVDARLEWSANEMFGGGALFAILLGTLISSAAATMRQAPALDMQHFTEASELVLDHVVQKNRAMLQGCAQVGWREALSALAAAKMQLQLQQS